MPFYISYLSICGFWYPQGSWNSSSVKMEGWLYLDFRICTTVSIDLFPGMGLLDQTVHAFKMLDIAKNLLKSRYLFTYPPAGNQKLPALLKKFSHYFWLCWVLVVAHGPSHSAACGTLVPPTRDRVCVPCTTRQILNHWTTWEIRPAFTFLVVRERRDDSMLCFHSIAFSWRPQPFLFHSN